MNAKSLFKWASVLSLVVGLTGIAAEAPATQISGTWKWSAPGPDGQTRESTLILDQTGERVKGTLVGPRGETAIEDGQVKDKTVTFKITRETQRGSATTHFTATLDGDVLRGTTRMQWGEREVTRDWAARQDTLDPVGTWRWTMTRDDGQDWTAQLRFKRENDQITGAFAVEGQDREMPLRNVKIKGSNLSFEVVFERGDRSMTMRHTAVLLGKVLKGRSVTEREGVQRTRDWTATKQ